MNNNLEICNYFLIFNLCSLAQIKIIKLKKRKNTYVTDIQNTGK